MALDQYQFSAISSKLNSHVTTELLVCFKCH